MNPRAPGQICLSLWSLGIHAVNHGSTLPKRSVPAFRDAVGRRMRGWLSEATGAQVCRKESGQDCAAAGLARLPGSAPDAKADALILLAPMIAITRSPPPHRPILMG